MLSPVEQVKSRLDVVEVVSGYLKLQKAGANLKALCPFHNEKTPSFFVSPARQSWHCFGCNKGGDIFSFVQETEGMEFGEALRILAQRAGVELKREPKAARDARTRLFEANELAAKFFETQLAKSATGEKARAYLIGRGLKTETIEAFRLGWAPGQERSLLTFLKSKGFTEKEIVDAGLALKTRSGTRDRFQGRILFPMLDGNNRVIGFTGRIFGREEGEYDPKYLNTPETPIFEKGRILYGLHLARKAIRREECAVLVEGQMDCLMAHQVGSENVVATSGTALTPQHLTLIRRLAETLVVSYDADAAGVESTKRSIELGLEAGLTVRIALVPSGKDPAELIKADPAAWKTLLQEGAKPIIGFLLEQALIKHDVATPEGKRAVTAAVVPMLARVANAVERSHWSSEVAMQLKVREETVWEELTKVKAGPARPSPGRSGGQGSESANTMEESTEESETVSVKDKSRRDILEQHLLALCILRGVLPAQDDGKELFASPLQGELYRAVTTSLEAGEKMEDRLKAFHVAAVATHRADAERIVFAAESMVGTLRDPEDEFRVCLREIQAIDLRERLDAISVELQAAEHAGDRDHTRQLTERFREHSASLSSLFTQSSPRSRPSKATSDAAKAESDSAKPQSGQVTKAA